MKYAYHDLSEDQFERLVVILCQQLFGIAVQGFAKGPDGGRDGKFVGTAERFPSEVEPWKGITIIQAKHTIGYNKHFFESDFFSEDGTENVLAKEVVRIKALRVQRQVDNYILFANRRLGGLAEPKIKSYLAKETKIPEASIFLCGVEQLEIWLKRYPSVAEIADLDPLDSPLIVSPDDLAEVVQALARQKELAKTVDEMPPTPRIPYEYKNKLNGLKADYADYWRRRFLKQTREIKEFLADPANREILSMYESVVEEFNLQIFAKRKDHQGFDDVIEYLVRLLFERDAILRQHNHKRLTRAMIFYMYWNCDIGKE